MDSFLAPATVSNVAVTAQTALRVPAVALAVNLIAGSIGSIPARIVREIDGSSEDASEHPNYRLVYRRANDRQTAAKLRERLAMDALLFGNAFAFVNRVGGRVVEIVRLDPHAVSIQIDPQTGEAIYRSTVTGAVLNPADLIHVPAQTSIDGVTGISPIALAREAIALAIVMEQRAARLFGTSARPSGTIEIPGDVPEERVKRMGANWRSAHEGAENGGKTPILTDGARFNPLIFSSVDAQFIEMRREQIVEIARAFNVPATMLFELSNGTFANVEQQSRQFVTYTLKHWTEAFIGEYERTLLSDEERDDHRVSLDTEALISVDTAAQAERIAKLRASGSMTANDARAELGLPARPDGDTLGSPYTTPGAAPARSQEPTA
nr:phage portal protein [Jiella avicenniae]